MIPAEFDREVASLIQLQREFDEALNLYVAEACRSSFDRELEKLKERLRVWFAEEWRRREEEEIRRKEEEARREAEAQKLAEKERQEEELRHKRQRMEALREYLVLKGEIEDATPPERVTIVPVPLQVSVPGVEDLLARLVQSQEALIAAVHRQTDVIVSIIIYRNISFIS